MLASLLVDAPADPFALARALGERPGLALLWADGGRVTYLACDPTDTRAAIQRIPSCQTVWP